MKIFFNFLDVVSTDYDRVYIANLLYTDSGFNLLVETINQLIDFQISNDGKNLTKHYFQYVVNKSKEEFPESDIFRIPTLNREDIPLIKQYYEENKDFISKVKSFILH